MRISFILNLLPGIETNRESPCGGDPVLDPLVDGLLDVGEQRLLLRPQQLLGRAALLGRHI